MRGVMIAALLIADNYVYMPASAYFESDYARILFNEFLEFRQLGFLRLIGSGYNIGHYVENKRIQYAIDHDRYPRYFSDQEVRRLLSADTNWLRRTKNSSRDISDGWSLSVTAQEKLWISLAQRHELPSLSKLEKNLLAVPERLGDTAFIVDFVLPLLQLPNPMPHDNIEINAFITQQFNYSYLRELGACCIVDLPFADSRAVLGEQRGHISYQKLRQLWRRLGIDHFLLQARDKELIRLRIAPIWTIFLQKYCWLYSLYDNHKQTGTDKQKKEQLAISYSDPVRDIEELIGRIEDIVKSEESFEEFDKFSERRFIMKRNLSKKPTLFIVHGHDDKTKLEVKNYLQNVLLLPEPIILHERPSFGKSIIEKFEAYSDSVDGAIILLTPDDVWAKDGTSEEIRRARQNVIFELGYFYAKFRRESGRVLLLYKGQLDLPSDISGIIYIDITDGVASASDLIRRELQIP